MDSIPLNKSWTQSESNLSDSMSSASQTLSSSQKKKRKRNKKYKKRASKSCTSDNNSSPNSSPPGSPRSTLSSLPSLSLSLPSLPSLHKSILPTSPRSHKEKEEKETITIFENGKRFNGKCIFIPETMEELFAVATDKLKLPSLASYVTIQCIIVFHSLIIHSHPIFTSSSFVPLSTLYTISLLFIHNLILSFTSLFTMIHNISTYRHRTFVLCNSLWKSSTHAKRNARRTQNTQALKNAKRAKRKTR